MGIPNCLLFHDGFKEIPIGECWLQQMNLERILQRYPKADSRHIDSMIGVKELWGQGLGTDDQEGYPRSGPDRP